MSAFSSVAIDGRSVSRAHRQALSIGKAALPPASERVRNGSRSAALKNAGASVVVAAAAPAYISVPAPIVGSAASGRVVSMQRRRDLSAGKGAGRVANATVAINERIESADTALPSPVVVANVNGGACGRSQARARRLEQSSRGRDTTPPAQPTRPRIEKSGTSVTRARTDSSRHVTGDARGSALPVSGTQYIGADSGAAWRAGGPKVGQARTQGGALVSGTLIRSKVRITGDEAGSAVTITGEADGRIEDDVTTRAGAGASAAAQFARQTDPHGHSVQSNLGRSARFFGSRERERQSAVESTDGGMPVTGSAIGRSFRVTGDEAGACREVTGNQYLAPVRRQAERGESAPPARLAAVARTWSDPRVTGIDVEQHPRVSGSEPGASAVLTGTPYQGARTTYGPFDDAAFDHTQARLVVRAPSAIVTGDTPLHDGAVTGTARGATRDVTGTPYYREALPNTGLPAPVSVIDERFSIPSPQRSAQLQAQSASPRAEGVGRITGSFAVGHGKITGNLEFVFRPRPPANGDVAARLRITGEGRAAGRPITGQAWGEHAHVTGTGGAVADARNPSERGSKPHAFAGARQFKALANNEEPKHLVTGMFGYSSDAAAKVTLSGGAQG